MSLEFFFHTVLIGWQLKTAMLKLFVNFVFNLKQVKNIVTATKVGFDHLSLDYTFQVWHIIFSSNLM